MNKFYGKVGYEITVDSGYGVFTPQIKTRSYYGDVTRNYVKTQSGDGANKDINVNNVISIVADPFAYEHVLAIRYVEWMGARYQVTNVEVSQPRLILTIGGVYNGPEEESSSDTE
ncbi:MAG: hypothetical protein LIP10_03490 [Clostridiales bacterium]|nr:hypothetical protein [Clostridiales bacterium]